MKIFLVALKIVVSASLLYFVVAKTGIDKIISTLGEINILSFILAVLVYILSIYMSSTRWRLLLPEGYKTRQLFSLYIIGSFFNNILPGVIGGDAVKAYYLNNEFKDRQGARGKGQEASELNISLITHRPSLVTALASVFMDRYIGFSALMFIGLTAFPFGFRYFRGSYIEWLLPSMVILFILGSLLIFGLRIGQKIKLLSGIYIYFSMYMKQRAVILKAFIISLIIQISGIFTVYMLSMGLKIDVPILPLFIFIPVIAAITSLPISISGIGVREASFVLLFGFLGLNPEQSTAISFAWFLSVATGSLTGLVEYLRYKKNSEYRIQNSIEKERKL